MNIVIYINHIEGHSLDMALDTAKKIIQGYVGQLIEDVDVELDREDVLATGVAVSHSNFACSAKITDASVEELVRIMR